MKRKGPAPRSLHGAWLHLGGEALAVFSHPIEEAAGDPPSGLTAAEHQVATLAAQGRRNQQIAVARGCSVATVAKHLESIYRKLSIHSRAELAIWSASRRETMERSPGKAQ